MNAKLSTDIQKFIISFVVIATIHSEAAVRYVDINNTAPTAPYIGWPIAATNIQDAVDLSSNGDTILVAEGLYALKTDITVTNNINILGAGNPELTIIDGGHNGRGFHLGATFSVIGGFTIRNGIGFSDEGGGIYCNSRSPVVYNCLIQGNVSGDGGGMKEGTAFNCLFMNNTAFTWGGGGISGGIAYDCSFIENEAAGADGGGLRLSDAFGCTVVSNTARRLGGGMCGGTASNCTFSGNYAMYGGGIASGTADDCEVRKNRELPSPGDPYFGGEGGGIYEVDAVNLLLEDNYAYWYGGGMYGGSALSCNITSNGSDEGGGAFAATIHNSLVVRNVADHGGGMSGGSAVNSTIYNNGGWITVDGARQVAATNCIIQGNDFFSGPSGSSYFHCCAPDAEHGVDGNITNAPEFVSSSDYRLVFNSPCIDAGNNSEVVWTSDLEGNPRIVNAMVDMGAYEYNPELSDSDSDGITDDWELMYFSCATGCAAAGYADADPCNNLAEYVAGTDPTNMLSYFRITKADACQEGFVVNWDAVSNRLYGIDWRADLINDFQSLEQDISYPQNKYTDTVHVASEQSFYSLNVKHK